MVMVVCHICIKLMASHSECLECESCRSHGNNQTFCTFVRSFFLCQDFHTAQGVPGNGALPFPNRPMALIFRRVSVFNYHQLFRLWIACSAFCITIITIIVITIIITIIIIIGLLRSQSGIKSI